MKQSLVLGGFLLLLGSCHPCWDQKGNSEILQCLNNYPVEDILANPKVAAHVSQHKTYVSLTTSPKRLSKIHWALKTLDLTYVDTIYLALPEKYKDKEEYGPTDRLEKMFPKLKIIRRKIDLGPIMKLLPAVEEVQALGDLEARVITIDDDTAYPKGMIGQLIKESVLKNAVIAGSGEHSANFGLHPYWPQTNSIVPAIDIVEGFGGVAYPAKYVDVDRTTKVSQMGTGKVCLTSDDVTISWVLAENRVPRFTIKNQFFPGVRQFDFGFEGDALHQGAGCEGELCGVHKRYRACARAILEKRL